jgi:predicted CopG family antitoxin
VKRITISISEELRERLRQEAFRSRMSMSELICSRLERTNYRLKRRAGAPDPLAEVEGIVRDGRLTCDVDQALYTR